jgi:hypothetical protein
MISSLCRGSPRIVTADPRGAVDPAPMAKHVEAVEAMLIGMAQAHDVDCIVVTDSNGDVLVQPIFGPNAPRDDDDPEGGANPTNAVLSFTKAQKHLAHLPQLSGRSSSANTGANSATHHSPRDGGERSPNGGASSSGGLTVSGQYRDHILVQFSDGAVTVTLTSRRTMGRCLGSLMALVPLVRLTPQYGQLCAALESSEG